MRSSGRRNAPLLLQASMLGGYPCREAENAPERSASDAVVCILRGGFTTVERTLLDTGVAETPPEPEPSDTLETDG